ncbi:hypothetical protein Salat_0655200 [Sesamum alatum]|uniref:Uncharacterized protein n=1 Tax=Sesamum alatum TaxID=300844 RepID=A0AAE1YSM4_9LAMI|nr:hypothetical protein Salat_0655200 [Sesamum alatum]
MPCANLTTGANFSQSDRIEVSSLEKEIPGSPMYDKALPMAALDSSLKGFLAALEGSNWNMSVLKGAAGVGGDAGGSGGGRLGEGSMRGVEWKGNGGEGLPEGEDEGSARVGAGRVKNKNSTEEESHRGKGVQAPAVVPTHVRENGGGRPLRV